jgi:REP element-mobilizing transposase RayT
MPFPDEFPERCKQCVKSIGPILNRQCKFCQELKFDECVLCDLNRLMQASHNFKCHAYQPVLTITDPSETKTPDFSGGLKKIDRQESILNYLRSDRIKYKNALALQKLNDDPDGVFMEIKYHFAWSVIHRKPVFRFSSDVFDFIYDRSLKCSELVRGSVNLLWLAPDHIHLYVESDGELSVETMVNEIKEYLNDAILSELTTVNDKLEMESTIWDKTYFAETIGD